MEKARTRDRGIATQLYWPSGDRFDRAGAFFAGLPYVTDVEPITELLVESGLGVFQPQYLGTYDSDGSFSPEAATDTAFRLKELLADGGSVRDLRGERDVQAPRTVSVAAAHSFGTNILLQAILRGFEPDLAILMSPFFEFGSERERAGSKVDMEKHVRHIHRALPLTVRMESVDVWERFFYRSKQEFPDPTSLSPASRTRILCVVGDEDSGIDAERSVAYANELGDRYGQALELVDYLVVPGGVHDQRSLLTPSVLGAIRACLR